MDYKVGDKVRIKTWKSMKNEYEVNKSYNNDKNDKDIIYPDTVLGFHKAMDIEIEKLKTNRIATIKKLKDHNEGTYYVLEEMSSIWSFNNNMIECLSKDYKEPIPITSRFEILDL